MSFMYVLPYLITFSNYHTFTFDHGGSLICWTFGDQLVTGELLSKYLLNIV
jgi:hypothetical protein